MKRLSALFLILTLFVVSMSAQDAVTTYAYNGKFKRSKITVSIWLEENTDGVVSGEIVYTSSKHKTPMRVLGTSVITEGVKRFLLAEYQSNGLISGHLRINKDMVSGAVDGTWENNDNPDKPISYKMKLTPVPFPKDKGGTLSYSSDPAGVYHYTHKHFWKGEIGGSVKIYNLKGDFSKMRVSISKNDPNLAEYEAHLFFDRGCLHGAISSCDLEFDVHVFQDFVWVINTSPGTGECDEFGAFTTLNGFYLKVE